jgi:hypothetical protein
VQAFEGRIFTWSSLKPTVDYYKRGLRLPASTFITELGTISASLPALADLWGCDKVCLVG